MKIITTRFGEVEVGQEHLIHFEDGVVGFPALKGFVLIESPSMPLILWLQAIDAPSIAFPLIEPWFFKKDYNVALTDADKHALNFEAGDRLKHFSVLTIPDDMNRMTVNMRAPIVIDITKATASQVILQDKTLEIRTPAYEAFSQAMANETGTISQSANNNSTAVDAEQDEAWSPVNFRDEGAVQSTAA